MACPIIQRLTAENRADLNRCDNSFTVEAELCPAAEDGRFATTMRPVTPFIKRSGPEIYNARS